jgi:lipopolysaccharide heptosyltransferase II
VLRLSSVGDIVLTEPVVAALRSALPDAVIGFTVKKQFRDLVVAHPAIDRVHELDTSSSGATASLARELKDAGYSAVVDLHHNLRTLRLARAASAPIVTSYRKRELKDAVGVRLLRRPFRARRLLVRRYLDALAPLGIDAPTSRPKLYLRDDDGAAAAALLERLGVGPAPFAAVVPGSVWATKRWPAANFAKLASGLASELGLRVVLLGSAAERELCEDVVRKSGNGVVNAAGEASLGVTGAVIERARLFVGNDSGPTHMAMALGVPSVALFGPTDPGQFDFTGHRLVYRDLACSACSFYGGERCYLGHWDCLLSVAPDEVLAAAAELVERGEDAE